MIWKWLKILDMISIFSKRNRRREWYRISWEWKFSWKTWSLENLSPFKNYFVNQIEYKLNFPYSLWLFHLLDARMNFTVDRCFQFQRVQCSCEKRKIEWRPQETCENNKSWDIRDTLRALMVKNEWEEQIRMLNNSWKILEIWENRMENSFPSSAPLSPVKQSEKKSRITSSSRFCSCFAKEQSWM